MPLSHLLYPSSRKTTPSSPLFTVLSVLQNGVAQKLSQCPSIRVAPLVCIYLVVEFSPCYLLTSLLSHLLSLHFFTSSFLQSLGTSLLSCPLVPPSFSTVTFRHVMFSVVLSPFVFFAIALPPLSLLSSSFLSLHCSFQPLSLSSLSIPSVSLVILIFIPFTISVSLAISAVRQSTFQHPKHWKVNPSSIVSAQDFLHPDKVKSTELWQWSYQMSPCLHLPLANYHISITKN